MARRTRSGFPLLRPVWRAALWSLTEFPALLESALPLTHPIPVPPHNILSSKPPAHTAPALPVLTAAAGIVPSNATACPVGTRVKAHEYISERAGTYTDVRSHAEL